MLQTDSHTSHHCTLPPPNEMLLKWAEQRPDDIYLKQIIERKFVEYSFKEVADNVLRLVTSLRQLGLNPGDKIGLISKNCAEWFICDLAMMMGDYISVPIFPTAGAETLSYCLQHSECKAVIIGKLDDNQACQQIINDLPQLISIAMPYASAPTCTYQLTSLIEQSAATDFRPRHDDNKLMSIVYTSGTSGQPKGAMLTYGAFSWTAQQLSTHVNINGISDRLFSYLPLAHITERVYIFGSSIYSGIETAFPESLQTFIEDVKMQRPTLFISVPRLWTLFQQRILEKLPAKRLNMLLKIPIINRLVKAKIAQGLGLDKARVLGCGSAPVSPALLKWYHKVGLNITEAWGLTESFAYLTLNYPFHADKIGSVGNAGPGVEIKIAQDNEILVRSHGLFIGYYKNPQQSQAMLQNDNWLYTGDIGELDSDGYLYIQGRKKDTFKTAKGKFVSPVPIEKKLFEHSRVEMMCLIGPGLPAPILLVVPHQFPNFDRPRYERSTHRIIDNINKELESHEQIKGVLMIKEPWSVENQILTPTLKIKRHLLEKKYHDIGANWPKDQLIIWEE